jgi:hypothetical protein
MTKRIINEEFHCLKRKIRAGKIHGEEVQNFTPSLILSE